MNNIERDPNAFSIWNSRTRYQRFNSIYWALDPEAHSDSDKILRACTALMLRVVDENPRSQRQMTACCMKAVQGLKCLFRGIRRRGITRFLVLRLKRQIATHEIVKFLPRNLHVLSEKHIFLIYILLMLDAVHFFAAFDCPTAGHRPPYISPLIPLPG